MNVLPDFLGIGKVSHLLNLVQQYAPLCGVDIVRERAKKVLEKVLILARQLELYNLVLQVLKRCFASRGVFTPMGSVHEFGNRNLLPIVLVHELVCCPCQLLLIPPTTDNHLLPDSILPLVFLLVFLLVLLLDNQLLVNLLGRLVVCVCGRLVLNEVEAYLTLKQLVERVPNQHVVNLLVVLEVLL